MERFQTFNIHNDLISETMMSQSKTQQLQSRAWQTQTKAWRRGYTDYSLGQLSNSNPYPYPSKNNVVWTRGWTEAKREKEQKVVGLQSLIISKLGSIFRDGVLQFCYLECQMEDGGSKDSFNAHPQLIFLNGQCFQKKSWQTQTNVIYYCSCVKIKS